MNIKVLSELNKAISKDRVAKAYRHELGVALSVGAKLRRGKRLLDNNINIDKFTCVNGIEVDGLIVGELPGGEIGILLEVEYGDVLDDRSKFNKAICRACSHLYRLKKQANIDLGLLVLADIKTAYIIDTYMLIDYYDIYHNNFIYVTDSNNQWKMSDELYKYISKDSKIKGVFEEPIRIDNRGVGSSLRSKLIRKLGEMIDEENLTHINIDNSENGKILSKFNGIFNDIVLDNREVIKELTNFLGNPDKYYIKQRGFKFVYGKEIEFGEIQLHKYKVPVYGDNYGIAMMGGREIGVWVDKFERFKRIHGGLEAKYRQNQTNCDIFIEDNDRRRKGDFYTPKIWVDEAHKYIEEEFGSDWKDRYIVWDCAAGTKNLTRDYEFGEENNNLLSTTLYKHDVDIANDLNCGSMSCEYDFLNDDVEYFEGLKALKRIGHEITLEDFKDSKLYRNGAKNFIKRALEGKPIIFFINPPYATKSNVTLIGNTGSMVNTKVSRLMKSKGVGRCSNQLYAQFIYRILMFKKLFDMTEVSLALFSNCKVQTATAFKELRDECNNNFGIKNAFMFSARHFEGCSDTWGVIFSIWKEGEPFRGELNCTIKDINKSGKVVDLKEKIIYNMDNNITLSEVPKAIADEQRRVEVFPQLTNPLNAVKEGGKGYTVVDSLGFICSNSNAVEGNNERCYIMSAPANGGSGFPIHRDNFTGCIELFTVKRLISGEHSIWSNAQDEYRVPDRMSNKEDYNQFILDSIIFSLFDMKQYASSLRGITYEGKEWDIINNFFWMSKEDMEELAIKYGNKRVLEDIRENGRNDRFLYDFINNIKSSVESKFSGDANLVLELANEIVVKSFKDRERVSKMSSRELRELGVLRNRQDGKDWHINTWDAGWYQIKRLAQISCKDELNRFNKEHEKLSSRLRPLVYRFGYLYQ